MDITVRKSPAMRLAAFVTRRPKIDFRGAWTTIHPAVKSQELVRPGVRFLAAFLADALDGPGSMQWYAGAMTLPDGLTVKAPLEELTIPEGAYAVGTYVGPYDGMPSAWGDFVGSLTREGHAKDLSRPCLEIYLDDPGSTPAAGLRTELCVPIAPH